MNLELNRRLLLAGGPIALLTLHQASQTTAATADDAEVNWVMDAFLAAYGAADIERMVALMAEDIYFEDPTFHLKARNREEMKHIYEPLRTAFRNVRITPFNRIVASPWGISQQRLAATLVQEGQSREIDVQGVSMFEIGGGRIKRWYDYYDVLTFRQQMGGKAAS